MHINIWGKIQTLRIDKATLLGLGTIRPFFIFESFMINMLDDGSEEDHSVLCSLTVSPSYLPRKA